MFLDSDTKLRDALFAMQKQKMDMQTKFNDIVLENKKLKDKELTYEPRIRKLETMKEQLSTALIDITQV